MSDTLWRWLQEPGFTILIVMALGWFGRHFGGVVIERLTRRLVRSSHFHVLSDDDVRKRQNTLIGLFTTVWRSLIVLAVAIIVFQLLFPAIDLTPVLASAGIIGIALGFGAQSIIKDFLSGVFIILENQYRIGDVVDIEGASGTVERISIRSTIMRDNDGNVHYIPNGNVTHVINKTMGYSRVSFSLAVDPSTNIDELAEIINLTGTKLAADDKWKSKILEPPRFLSIGSFSDTALEVKITGKTQPSAQWSVTGELRKRLLSTFKKQGIKLATLPTGLPVAQKKR